MKLSFIFNFYSILWRYVMWLAECTDLNCTLWWLLLSIYTYLYLIAFYMCISSRDDHPHQGSACFYYPENFLKPICTQYTSQEEPWFCHRSLVLHVIELYINRLLQYVLFCVWLFSLPIMVFFFICFCFLRFILVACIWILPFSVAK